MLYATKLNITPQFESQAEKGHLGWSYRLHLAYKLQEALRVPYSKPGSSYTKSQSEEPNTNFDLFICAWRAKWRQSIRWWWEGKPNPAQLPLFRGKTDDSRAKTQLNGC